MTTDRNSEGAEMLPCPFCGPSYVYAYTRDGTDQTVAIRCNSCGATTADFKSDPETFSGEPDAIAAWNRRASPSAAEVQALVERLRVSARTNQDTAYELPDDLAEARWHEGIAYAKNEDADELARLIPRNPE